MIVRVRRAGSPRISAHPCRRVSMPLQNFVFTSESVSEGHPDTMCDQISDGILDALLREDRDSRVACESLAKTGMVVVAGEITTKAKIDFPQVVRETVKEIGYVEPAVGFGG